MERDEQRRTAKVLDVQDNLAQVLSSSFDLPLEAARESAQNILELTCTIEAPEEEPAPVMHWITLDVGGIGGGKSLKAGNILLDMRKLVATAAKGTLSAAGVVVHPWMAPFALLILWDDLWSRASVEIKEREATVVWSLWTNRDYYGCVPKGDVLELVNVERARHGRLPLSSEELSTALTSLEKMKCIEDYQLDTAKWWIREWVRVDYR